MNAVVILAATFVQTILLAWLEARGRHTLHPTEAELSRIDARLCQIGPRFGPLTPNGMGAAVSASIIGC
jgi:hypothetical protein